MMHGELMSNRYKLASGNAALQTALVNNAYHPASGSFVNVQGVMAVHIWIFLGGVADDITLAVYQAESASGTPDAVTGLTKTLANATDDGQTIYFYLDPRKLADEDHHWITVKVSSVSGNNYAKIVYMLEAPLHQMPVTQTTTELPTDNVLGFTGYGAAE